MGEQVKTKKCKRCKETKLTAEFYFNSGTKDGYSSYCKNCHKEKSWSHNLHRLYGITVAQYELMLKSQDGVCAICRQSETCKDKNGDIQRLAVDHRHKPFKIRSLLCHKCNIILGNVEENPEILRKAIKYLEKHQ